MDLAFLGERKNTKKRNVKKIKNSSEAKSIFILINLLKCL